MAEVKPGELVTLIMRTEDGGYIVIGRHKISSVSPTTPLPEVELEFETSHLTPEETARWNEWLKSRERSKRMSYKSVALMAACMAIIIVGLLIVVPLVLAAQPK